MSDLLIKDIWLKPYTLTLQNPWRFADKILYHRDGVLLKIQTCNDLIGTGDCAPLPEMGTETLAQAYTSLCSCVDHLKTLGTSVAQALSSLSSMIPKAMPCVRHALEYALLDLQAQAAGLNVSRLIHPAARSHIAVNANLGSLDAQITKRLQNAITQAYKICKIKVGVNDLHTEITALHAICADLPETLSLRLDANQAWPLSKAHEFLHAISNLPIESIEEPLINPCLEDLCNLQRQSSITIALDESLPQFLTQKKALFNTGILQRLVLKPALLGGILPTFAIAKMAQEKGLSCVVTTMLESAIGVYAVIQLAAAIDAGQQPCAHGLATSQCFTTDLAPPPCIERGRIVV